VKEAQELTPDRRTVYPSLKEKISFLFCKARRSQTNRLCESFAMTELRPVSRFISFESDSHLQWIELDAFHISHLNELKFDSIVKEKRGWFLRVNNPE
jgi:hypothetical protein